MTILQKQQSAKPPLATLEKGLLVLEFIAQSNQLIRLRDVANHFSMDRSTALRFLKTLEMTGFIEKYEGLKAYAVGPRLNQLTSAPPSREKLLEKIKPYLVDMAESTQNVAHIAVLEGENVALAGVAQSPARVTVKQAVGDLEPLYCSAVGKALYAFMPEEERFALGKAINYIKHTEYTLTNYQDLEAEAEQIREQGVAFDNKEGSLDICCIAVPLFNQNKQPIFSVGISMVAGVANGHPSTQHDLIQKVRLIAEKISMEIHR